MVREEAGGLEMPWRGLRGEKSQSTNPSNSTFITLKSILQPNWALLCRQSRLGVLGTHLWAMTSEAGGTKSELPSAWLRVYGAPWT